MRGDFGVDGEAPAFTLSCAGYKDCRSHAGATTSHGNLSFTIGEEVVAEIDHDDLVESWQAACQLTAAEAGKMTEAAGARLADILECGLEAADLPEAVTDAAVVFLLAMKRQGIADPKRIPACTVLWNGHENRERVLLGA